MADKEASVFIIDLGRSMGAKRHGRDKSDLDYSLQYVYDKISNIIYQERKGLVVGILGFRTDKTSNAMQDEDGYDNIDAIQLIQNMYMPELRRLPEELTVNGTDDGDALSAVILGVDMIMKHCRQLKYTKRLYLITNGTGPLDATDVESTAAQIKQNNIQLTILGVDFDDAEYGFKEEDKPFQKQENEKALKQLATASDGVYATMAEAIDGLQQPHRKLTKPIPSYKGQLRLGDPEAYDTAITIDIERYPKVMIRKPPSASSYVQREPASQQHTDGNTLASVKSGAGYRVKDDEADGGWRDVERDDLARGYEYGRTAVHVSEADENVTKLETMMSYEILGFIPQENVERYVFLGQTHMLVAQRLNDKAAYALSSLIHALFEVGSVAIGRLVKKDMSEPQLTMLSPHVDQEIECLIENEVPFAEDLRTYRFPPLDKIITVSGKPLKSHRNLPSEDLMSAMSSYMDSMSLVSGDSHDERFAIVDVYSPLLHTIEGVVKYRAVHPDEPIPPKAPVLLEPSQVPSEIQERSRDTLKRLVTAADVKKVPAKVKGRARYRDREADKPISGLDIDALLKKPEREQIGSGTSVTIQIDPKNAIPEFKRLFEDGSDADHIEDATKQISKIVQDLVRTSMGESNYNRAIETLGVARELLSGYEFFDLYNEMIKSLKSQVAHQGLGGDRRDFWYKVRIGKLGLVVPNDEPNPNEEQKFYRLKE